MPAVGEVGRRTRTAHTGTPAFLDREIVRHIKQVGTEDCTVWLPLDSGASITHTPSA